MARSLKSSLSSTRTSGAIDQAGVAIFFVQRHRIELTLKGRPDELGSPDVNSHDLKVPLQKIKAFVQPEDPAQWLEFDEQHGELVRAVAEVDKGSIVFRYPVGNDKQLVERPDYVDLDVPEDRVEGVSLRGDPLGRLRGRTAEQRAANPTPSTPARRVCRRTG
jgi:hypothetical protein